MSNILITLHDDRLYYIVCFVEMARNDEQRNGIYNFYVLCFVRVINSS